MGNELNTTISLAFPKDKTVWDDYVSNHNNATAYHRFAWQEAVQSAYNHKVMGLIARSSETKQVVGVLPAVLMTTPLMGKKLCSLPYCDVGYAIADSDEIQDQLVEHLKQLGVKTGSKHVEVRNVAATPEDSTLLAHKKVRMLLPLPSGSDALLASFKSKLRSQIRKAEKNGLIVQLGLSTALIDDFYNVYAQNMKDLGSPVHAKRWFQHIISTYGDSCIVSVVYKDDIAIGGGLVIKSGSQASIPWASTLRNYNKLAPNMLLYWSLLAHCADNNICTFDFGRSTFEEGTYRFKKQWGATPQLLDWQIDGKSYSLTNDTASNTSPSKIRPAIESVWRKLPLNLTITVGSAIRPYISL
ncbi:FemAB family PEP-CTERM system-associated protein [Alteromonas sp. ALT199]|uniref:FemAB family XrtA/PEP-CTERM system-associated protein n=1 Tax=unclassified Alteromonas TaxID=2614992 RepID=UPI001BEA8DEE|nr:FemAB family XrtA/PEP-CTERM system-associated protein [Alteromonas sp. ALT199]MBT3137297.1 FemAB family PEP-CTERM system-associated protein [Alteromonas sp. ALT199]